MLSTLSLKEALKRRNSQKSSWTTNNKNSSNSFSFNQGTYSKNPKYKIDVKKSFNDLHQN